MRYFDFHAHVVFKQIFADNPNINSILSENEVKFIPGLCTDLPNIVESQIHQVYLANFGEEVIIGVVLYGLESYIAEQVIPLRTLLKTSSQHKLSLPLLKSVASNNTHAFTDFTLNRTLQPYLTNPATFQVLDKSSFDNPLPLHKVNIFFVVEGCHSFVDSVNRFDNNNHFPPAEILANLDILLQHAPVLSINPTHMQQSNLCNHAFAMQLAKPDPFFPMGNGLQEDGREVIRGIFQKSICVDIKHMSYKSRLELMQEIDAGAYDNPQPLLCTHAAFTGMPFSDWPGHIILKKPVNGVIYVEISKSKQTVNMPEQTKSPTFNASTINLFDEEIIWIITHGGMIGLSMDRRILGYVDQHDDNPTGIREQNDLVVDKEFLSVSEWTALNINDNQIGELVDNEDCLQLEELKSNTDAGEPTTDYFYTHVMLQLKHYFQVCYHANIPVDVAQMYITMGSDFDGLINPFNNMATVNDIPDLRKYLKRHLIGYLESLTDSAVWAKDLKIDVFLEDFFYSNGMEFVKTRFV